MFKCLIQGPGVVAVLLVQALIVGALGSDRDLCKNLSNGCSVPDNLPTTCEAVFTPACDRHDACYFCGHHFGVTREQCDSAFLHDMKVLCTSTSDTSCLKPSLPGLQLPKDGSVQNFLGFLQQLSLLKTSPKHGQKAAGQTHTCQQVADVYYMGVSLFGAGSFNMNSSASAEKCIGYSSCMPRH